MTGLIIIINPNIPNEHLRQNVYSNIHTVILFSIPVRFDYICYIYTLLSTYHIMTLIRHLIFQLDIKLSLPNYYNISGIEDEWTIIIYKILWSFKSHR